MILELGCPNEEQVLKHRKPPEERKSTGGSDGDLLFLNLRKHIGESGNLVNSSLRGRNDRVHAKIRACGKCCGSLKQSSPYLDSQFFVRHVVHLPSCLILSQENLGSKVGGRKEVRQMKLEISGSEKEIAALVVAIQGRREVSAINTQALSESIRGILLEFAGKPEANRYTAPS